MNLLPMETAVLAQTPKGTVVRLGGKMWTVGGRPKPGFVELTREGEEPIFVRLRTRVNRLASGKVVQA